MKTKKAILKWWEDLGKKEHSNDLKEFYANIETFLIAEDLKTKEYRRIVLKAPKWKYSLSLIFDNNNECFRILGF